MERIKALLAVALFVASLIFATPMLEPKTKIIRPSQKKYKAIVQKETDSLIETYYTYQPKIDNTLTGKTQ